MTQPRADRIDVDPGAEQVHGGCVPQSVGAHSLGEQGGGGERRYRGGALDERVDAVAGECPALLVEKHRGFGGAVEACAEQVAQGVRGAWPERADALLAALADKARREGRREA